MKAFFGRVARALVCIHDICEVLVRGWRIVLSMWTQHARLASFDDARLAADSRRQAASPLQWRVGLGVRKSPRYHTLGRQANSIFLAAVCDERGALSCRGAGGTWTPE
jgi:hypothetical protein